MIDLDQILINTSNLIVALDSETSGLFVDDGARISTISIAYKHPNREVVSYALPFDQGVQSKHTAQGILKLEPAVNLSEADWYRTLDWLERQWLVFHNAKFDLHMFCAGTNEWVGRDLSHRFIWDTMVAASCIEPKELVGLKPVGQRLELTDGSERQAEYAMARWVEKSKPELKKLGIVKTGESRNPRMDLAPWSIMEPYASQDTLLTYNLFLWQQNWAQVDFENKQGVSHKESVAFDTPIEDIIHRRFEVMLALYNMEKVGLRWNFEQAEIAALAANKRIAVVEKLLIDFGVERLSAPGMIKWLQRNLAWRGEIAYGARTTASGNQSLDSQELDRLLTHWQGTDTDIEMCLVLWKELHDLNLACDMWFEGYTEKMGQDGRLRTSFRQLKTVTGRMSVERINLQALPREGKVIAGLGVVSVKDLIVPSKGYDIWNLDLSQAELRVGAKVANCRNMIYMLENGLDFHGETASSIFGNSYNPSLCAKAEVPSNTLIPKNAEEAKNKHEADVWKVARQVGKTVTFSSLFMGSEKALRRALGAQARLYISQEDARQWVDSWRKRYWEIPKAWKNLERFAHSKGFVVLGGGHIRERSWLLGGGGRREAEPYQAYNRVVQGGIALLNQEWIRQAHNYLKDADGSRLILNVHDSLVLEVPHGSLQNESDVPIVVEQIAMLASVCGRQMFDTKIVVDYSPWGK